MSRTGTTIRSARKVAGLALATTLVSSAGCSSCRCGHSHLHKRVVVDAAASEDEAPEPATSASSEPTAEEAVGHVIWHDLVTRDPVSAAAFYGSVAGWKTTTVEGGYTVCANDTGALAGISKLGDDLIARGVRPFWTASVDVANVDAVAKVATASGGRVYAGPMDIPTGRFASIGDPLGPAIYLTHPTKPVHVRDTNVPGELSWNELESSDVDAAVAFYKKVFGWRTLSDTNIPPVGRYVTLGLDGVAIAVHATPVSGANFWQLTIQVADLDGALTRVASKGGKVLIPAFPMQTGRLAIAADPDSVAFAVFGP